MDDFGFGGGPCSIAVTAVLDFFLAEVISDFITEQVKDAQVVETILETTPSYMLSLFLVSKVRALAG